MEGKLKGDRRLLVADGGEIDGVDRDDEGLKSCTFSLASSSSSSIGKNSDVLDKSSSEGENDSGEIEVQSSYKGPFVSMEALEEVLPIRRGISSFYSGKSKSFASLADTSSLSSMKNISKPENAYTRKRRNLLAFSHVWETNKTQNTPLKSITTTTSKKPPLNSSQRTLALPLATMSSSESTTSEDSNSRSPLCPPWRSFSVADLQYCATDSTSTRPGTFKKDDI